MFFGAYTHSLDDKGRVIMPAKFRVNLGDSFYIMRDLWNKDGERCLFVYSSEGFDDLVSRLRNMHKSQEVVRQLGRQFFPSVQETDTDPQGRLVLSADLRNYAGLGKEIVLAGLDDHIEIWNKEQWEAYQNNTDPYSTGQLAESLEENGI